MARRGERTQSADQPDDAGVEEILRLAEAANVRGIARRRRRFRRRVLLVLTVILAVCAAAASWFGFRGGDEPTSKATASPTAIAPATRSIPDFVWVAATGATHYRVEFLRGTRVVHTAKTSVPRLHVTAASLPPGRYRWRVWVLDRSGAPTGRPIVDASVDLR